MLDRVDLDVPPGSFTAILGRSGSGKTTLLRLVAGFERPDAGQIEFDGACVASDGAFVVRERWRVGVVVQEGLLFPHLDVAGDVAFGLGRVERKSGRVPELLELVGLAGLERRRPHELSGGQQQRVGLARALAPAPRLVLLDEPFSALDPELRVSLRADVRRVLAQTATTALLVTHDQAEALSLADRVAILRDGRIVQAGAPHDLYRGPADADVARFLGEANLLAARRSTDRVETALGPFTAPHDGQRADAELVVLLRPEDVSLTAPATAALHGEVDNVQFFGDHALVAVSLRERTSPLTLVARTSGTSAPRRRELVGVRLPQAAYVLPTARAVGAASVGAR